jgi:hypothetical protein
MPPTPNHRLVRAARQAARLEEQARCLDIFLRIRGYKWDDAGENLLLDLAPADETRAQ